MLVKAHDDVPFAHSALPGRTTLLERYNENAAFNWKEVIAHDSPRQRNILSPQADVTAADSAVANQTARDKLRSVERVSKTDPPRRQNHRGLDANYLAT